MNTGAHKMESQQTGMWVSFFTAAGIPSEVAATYALTFAENRIQNDMLLDLNKEYLRDMGITRMGDVIAILRHAKQVHESTARDRVLSTTVVTAKVPVAAVTGRATITQPGSPASRILEHYTRNPQVKEALPVTSHQLKRKSADFGSKIETNIKKARLIRFGSPPQPAAKEAMSAKQTVFARLGNSEPIKPVVPVKTISTKTDVKPIYARLGSKSKEDQVIPVPRDALKYEGILKSGAPEKKVVTIITTKNNVRKIAMECTMRADETPLSVKEKLALPKSKSVKFSNTVQYKEIEAIKKPVARPALGKPVVNKVNTFTTVFNKPERRLSMPDGANVKERLGMKNIKKNSNNLTITRNVFNRLGV